MNLPDTENKNKAFKAVLNMASESKPGVKFIFLVNLAKGGDNNGSSFSLNFPSVRNGRFF